MVHMHLHMKARNLWSTNTCIGQSTSELKAKHAFDPEKLESYLTQNVEGYMAPSVFRVGFKC